MSYMRKLNYDHTVRQEKIKQELQKKYAYNLAKEKKIAVKIDAIYQERLGSSLPITVGLNTITIPVNGQTYTIPESFAEALQTYLEQINKEVIRSNQSWRGNYGDVSANGEIPGKSN